MMHRLAIALAAVVLFPSTSFGADAATMEARAKLIAERDRLQAEINSLGAAANVVDQVYVNVQVLEINLDSLRRLGADFSTTDGQTFMTADLAEMLASGRISELNAEAVRGVVDLLLAKNVAKLRANPQLVTVNGQKATLHVGGKAPVVAPPGVNQAPQFLAIGTQLELVAELLGDRQVQLSIDLELSELHDGRSVVREDGWRVPAVDSTQCQTICTMRLGEAATLCGTTTTLVESIVRPDGSQGEVTREFATWIVVHANDAVPAAPQASVVPAAHAQPVTQ
jgi:Flp pilus assembly secretin CpaC